MSEFFVGHTAVRTAGSEKGHNMTSFSQVKGLKLAFGCCHRVEVLNIVNFLGRSEHPVVGAGEAEYGHSGGDDGGKPNIPTWIPVPCLAAHGKK